MSGKLTGGLPTTTVERKGSNRQQPPPPAMSPVVTADAGPALGGPGGGVIGVGSSSGGPGGVGGGSGSGRARDSDAADLEKAALLGRTGSKSVRAAAVAQAASKEALVGVVHSWFAVKFARGCAILAPIVITFWITFHFLRFFDGLFSPIYRRMLGFEVFGLGLATSVAFVTLTGVLLSSWVGSWVVGLGESLIGRLPLVRQIYSATKQVSAALSPEGPGGSGEPGRARAFQECVLVKHPRHGEYAIGFITGRTMLQTHEGDLRLNAVYIPTNHVYVGDIFLLQDADVVHTNLTVRDGLELVVSVGMALPPSLTAISRRH